ncbi:MAG: hypothetical protein ACOX47_05535 [Bacillota bacterium]|jgi:hypothetical protein
MTEKHFDRYFINADRKQFNPQGKLDMISSKKHDLIGFYFHSAWYKKPCVIEEGEYALAYDELFAFVGQDMDNPRELGAELSFTINSKEYITDKSCMILVPKHVPHGPVKFNRVDRPVFGYVGGASREKVALPKVQWTNIGGELDFKDYVLHFNGVDDDEAMFEVFRLHGEDDKMVGSFGGVFYGKFRWFRTTTPHDYVFAPESHAHSLPEMLNFFSTDPDDPYDLGAEIDMKIMGEEYHFNQTTALFIPSNQPHCPLNIKKVDRPFMFFTLMPDCKVYLLDK